MFHAAKHRRRMWWQYEDVRLLHRCVDSTIAVYKTRLYKTKAPFFYVKLPVTTSFRSADQE